MPLEQMKAMPFPLHVAAKGAGCAVPGGGEEEISGRGGGVAERGDVGVVFLDDLCWGGIVYGWSGGEGGEGERVGTDLGV